MSEKRDLLELEILVRAFEVNDLEEMKLKVAEVRSLLSTAWQAEWLKTEDALPKDGEIVMTYGAKRMGMAVMQYTKRDGWQVETPSEWHNAYAPTHWRTLPTEPDTTPRQPSQ